MKKFKLPYQKHNGSSTWPLGLVIILTTSMLSSCGSNAPVLPKPRIYPKVILPTGSLEPFSETACPLSFEKPSYTNVELQTRFFDEKPSHPCWFDLVYPELNCRIHFSYSPIDTENSLEQLNEDAYRMTNEHNKKASYIEELQVANSNGVTGVLFDLEGAAATPFQFYLTDSVDHFLRGALYFNTRIVPDSLAPYYEFVKGDIAHMINTFEFN